MTLLYESGVDPLVAMKIVGHTDYQTTANIYTHLKEETLKKASVNMEKVFRNRAGSNKDVRAYLYWFRELVIKGEGDRETGRLLSEQIVGFGGVDKWIDVFVTAITSRRR